MDRETTSSALGKRRKRTITQTSQDSFDAKAVSNYYSTRYSNAWKGGTQYYNDVLSNPDLRGKKGYGARTIAAKINQNILSSPNDRKIKPTAFERAVKAGNFGVSPPKRGRKFKVPLKLTNSLATHSTMMHISGEGEASRPKLLSTMHALVTGTRWENKFSHEYVYRRMRREHPEILNPVRAKNHEDRRVDWLSYKNIMTWNTRAKKFLIDIGMAKDEPGLIRESICYIFHSFILCTHHLSWSCLLICRWSGVGDLSHPSR